MSVKKTRFRERMLINVLPAALVLALYAFLFALPTQKTYQKNLDELNSMQATAVDQTAADLSRSNLEMARSTVQRLNDQLRTDREHIAFLGKNWSSGDARLPIVQQVTELLQQFNLSIEKQVFEKEPRLSEYLKELETIVKKHSIDDENLEYWQIELAGGYSDMMNFLNEIRTSGLRTFPVTLSMKASENGDGIHTWTVVFVV